LTYNPILDLVVGLFLILTPIAVLAWLGVAWVLVARRESQVEQPRDLDEALNRLGTDLRDLLNRDGEVSAGTRAELTEMLHTSERLRTRPAAPPDTELTSQPDA
jgi:hypothetical protein